MKVFTSLGHVARYLAGAGAAAAVFALQCLVVVIPLALLGMLGSGLLGGLMALLIGLAAAVLGAIAVVSLIVFPAILLAEALARRTHWATAPITILVGLLGLSVLVTWVWQTADPSTSPQIWLTFALTVLPALAFGLITYPAAWISARLTGFLRRRLTPPSPLRHPA